ncbi:hypothetical protein K7432_004302 [Basidiobolus ranarum]|uniref:alpha-1,2-Mannosidase n=1 Tax=Basidiobolus ranarum TaxID=34480 RepID=A0ABR2WYC9_9FUNG
MPNLPRHLNETRAVGNQGSYFLRLFNPRVFFRRRLVILIFSAICLLLIYCNSSMNSKKFDFTHSENGLTDQTEAMIESKERKPSLIPAPKLNNPADRLYQSIEHKQTSLERQRKIKAAVLSTWSTYYRNAFGQDEIAPLTKEGRQTHNGWGATAVDSLDTLLVLYSQYDYIQAKQHVKTMNFSQGTNVPFFETISRYIGGLLGAYELMQDSIMSEKAAELGKALAQAFESPSGIPYSSLNFTSETTTSTVNTEGSLLGEIGGIQIEFNRLTQITGKSFYFEKSQQILEILSQKSTPIRGLYPQYIDPNTGEFKSNTISMEKKGHRFYETLLKQYLFSVNTLEQYRNMYEQSMDALSSHLIYRNSQGQTFLTSLDEEGNMLETMNHEACAVPGMLALGAQTLDRPQDLQLAEELMETCIQMAAATSTGLSPSKIGWTTEREYDTFTLEHKSQMIKHGFYVLDKEYQLWPEMAESLFMLYRVTSDRKYQETGWQLFLNLQSHCKAGYGFSGLKDVNDENSEDNRMESQFLGKSMKYLYLLFTANDFLPIDEYLFTTGGHVIRIPRKWESLSKP